MLAGSGFGDEALLAHAKGQEGLAEGVVDLVGAGVVEVFPFEINLGPAEFFGEAARQIKAAGPAGKFVEVVAELLFEFRIGFGVSVFGFKLLESADQCFRYEDTAVRSEVAGCVRRGDCDCALGHEGRC